MGRMHSDASSLAHPQSRHVEMMGLIGMGNNPMVGASRCRRAIEEASNKTHSQALRNGPADNAPKTGADCIFWARLVNECATA